MDKYSKNIKVEDRTYRYNYTECELEYIYKDNGEWVVITSVGMTQEGFKADGKTWARIWDAELQEELSYMMAEFM